MFWRKKQRDTSLFSHDSNDRRAYFRACQPYSTPLTVKLRGRFVLARNIGAGGLCIPNGGFSQGDSLTVSFDLPGENTGITGTMEIVEICRKGLCHCRFVGLGQDAINAIHRYVLAIQKQALRTRRYDWGQFSQPRLSMSKVG
jgi:hypothetical protein